MDQRIIDSPVGCLLLGAQEGKLVQVRLINDEEKHCDFLGTDPVLEMAQEQIAQYFAGERAEFDLPIVMQGTAFECALWQQLVKIPFGETTNYGNLANILGKPSASRAVGRACSRNPLLIVVPCHRVVAASGRLTGFSGGMEAKRSLLILEGHTIEKDKLIK